MHKVLVLIVSSIGVGAFLAGCQTTETQAARPTTVATAPAVASASLAPLPNGTLRAFIAGDEARLSVSGGQPVGYNWGTFQAQDVRRLPNGDIRVDAATLRNVSVSDRQVSGIWDFRGQQTPVTFR